MAEMFEQARRVLESFGEVRLAYVFGSYARGAQKKSSDLDVAVLLAPDAGTDTVDRITLALEKGSGRNVDLVDLSRAPALLAHEVVSTGKLLFSRDDAERAAFAARAVSRYLDTAHLREIQHQYLRERAEAHSAPPQ